MGMNVPPRKGFAGLDHKCVNPKVTPSQWDIAMAARLRTIVKSRGKFVSRDKTKWAHQFRMLRSSLFVDESEKIIESVLSWYGKNHDKPKVPNIVDGKQFKDRFEWLRDLSQQIDSEPVSILPEDKKIADEIKTWNWPAGLQKDLSAFVAVVRKQYQTVKAKLTAYLTGLEKYADGRPKDSFAQTVHSFLMSMPSTGWFIKNWSKAIQQKILFAVDKHGGWKGDLIRTHGTLLGVERFESWAATLIKSETKWQKIKSEVLS